MTFADPTRECSFAMGYEQLRRRMLEGATAGGCFGLVILLREGVAAWMAHARSSPPPAVAPATSNDHPSAMVLIASDVHTDMAHVLANMVMTIHEERCA